MTYTLPVGVDGHRGCGIVAAATEVSGIDDVARGIEFGNEDVRTAGEMVLHCGLHLEIWRPCRTREVDVPLSVGAKARKLVRSGAVGFNDPPKRGKVLGEAQRREGEEGDEGS